VFCLPATSSSGPTSRDQQRSSNLIGIRPCLPRDFLTLSAGTFLRYVYIKPATIPVRARQRGSNAPNRQASTVDSIIFLDI
jgi:hypothetical protein